MNVAERSSYDDETVDSFFHPQILSRDLAGAGVRLRANAGGKAGGATVTVCDEASLRAALSTGEEVVFGCDGTIVLSNTLVISASTTLNGNGHAVVLSGNGMIRVIEVEQGSVRIDGVGIANGFSTNGAGLYNHRGSVVTLANSTLSNNVACGSRAGTNAPVSDGKGGGIYNDHGLVGLTNVTVIGNAANGGTNGAPPSGSIGRGGGVFNDGGTVVVRSSRFYGNQARGSEGWTNTTMSGTAGYDGYGGAIYNAGTLRVYLSLFETNSAIGGKGGNARSYVPFEDHTGLVNGGLGGAGAKARGGAIFNAGAAQFEGSTFRANTAASGNGGNGGGGWSAAGSGGAGGESEGGALFHQSSTLAISACTFSENAAVGGGGGGGAWITTTYSVVYDGPGGTGGNGGSAYGGGIYALGGMVDGTNNTFAGNRAQGSQAGNGGNGGHGQTGIGPAAGGNGGNGGSAYGGAIYFSVVTANWLNQTIAFNQSSSGYGGVGGIGGVAYGGTGHAPSGSRGLDGAAPVGGIAVIGGTLNLANSIIAFSTPSNCLGGVLDGGYNLVTDSSGTFTNAGSILNIDPILGPLTDNGGPTATMELLPGSPAVNAGGDLVCPPLDQRGLARPQYGRCDIGAFEQATILSPLAVTGMASNVTDWGATLYGSVHPNVASPVTAFFQWGTTTDYGNTSQVQQLAGGIDEVVVQYELENLIPDQDYHFRIVAVNQVGETYGADQVFHTSRVMPRVRTGLASSVRTNSVVLNGTVNPRDCANVRVFFEWGTSTNYSERTAAEGVGVVTEDIQVSSALVGLAADTVYHFRLVALNENGTSYGADEVCRTLPVPVVDSRDETSLRQALSGGGQVVFAVDGTITLTQPIVISKNTELDGSGHSVILSGGNSVRLFTVTPGTRLTLLNLTLANGRSPSGGVIYNDKGTVIIGNCDLSNNCAMGEAGLSGALGTNGSNIYPTTRGGHGGDGSDGQDGIGGAIVNDGSMVISNSVLVFNSAIGGPGGDGGNGGTGGIFCYRPYSCVGGDGGNGGQGGRGGKGYGGSIHNTGTLTLVDCRLLENWTRGGAGGTGGMGGRSGYPNGWMPKAGTGGAGGLGGHTYGGAICNMGSVQSTNCVYGANSCFTGGGGLGGDGGSSLEVSSTDANVGGVGGAGGSAYGGALYNQASMVLANTTVTNNQVAGANGAAGGDSPRGAPCGNTNGIGGNGFGGGIANVGTLTRVNTSFLANHASGGIGGSRPPPCWNDVPGANGVGIGSEIYSTGPMLSALSATFLTPTSVRLDYEGEPGGTYVLQGAVDFTNWSNIRTNIAGADGRIEFEPVDTSGYPLRFFRAVSGSP